MHRNQQETQSPGHENLKGSALIFLSNRGHGNPRKRGRTEAAANGTNQFSVKFLPNISESQKMKCLNQLQDHHLTTDLKLEFYNQTNPSLPSSSSSLCKDFATPINQCNKEFDELLQVKRGKLRLASAEKQGSYYMQLDAAALRSASQILIKKQMELNLTVRKTTELQKLLAHLQTKSLALQAKAMAEQKSLNSLYVQLQKVIRSANSALGRRGKPVVEDAESAYIDPGRAQAWNNTNNRLVCQLCRNRTVSVIVLPCRHLCLCEDCDSLGVEKACPVCNSVRNGSVRVFLS